MEVSLMKAIRLQRFRAFEDSGWIEFKPITLLFGYNSAGKSTILQALLMLKQSIQNPATDVPFVFSSDKWVDLGAYQDVVYQHKIDHGKPMVISMKVDIPEHYLDLLEKNETMTYKYKHNRNLINERHEDYTNEQQNEKLATIEYSVEISYNQKQRFIDVIGFKIISHHSKNVLSMHKKSPGDNAKGSFTSDFIDIENYKMPLFWYNFLPLVKSDENLFVISRITESIMERVQDTLNRLVNIGPVRAKPERSMLFSGEKPSNVGIKGEETFKLLYSDKFSDHSKHLDKKINKWLHNYGYQFEWKMMQKSNRGEFVLNEIVDGKKIISANIVDVGFGISQVLPIAVQLYAMENNGLLLIEQPEIHLHSKAQADLADLFIDAIQEGDKVILAETHSENLLLRLRRRIADGSMKHEDVGVYYVQHHKGSSTVNYIDLNEYGDMENMPDEFKKFFQDDFNEIMLIHKEKSKKLAEMTSTEEKNNNGS